jgi:branched-chain amino acid aminotransferase
MENFDFKELKVFYKGEYVPFKEATITLGNISFLYGLSLFSGCRGHWNEKENQLYLFRVDEHFKRLTRGANMVHMKNFLAKSFDDFKGHLVELCKVNEIKQDVYIRVNLFYTDEAIGPKFIGYNDDMNAYLYPLGDYVPTGGMKCMTSSFERVGDNSIPARLKVNGAYVNTAFAKTEALENGFDEAIVLDRNGHAVEGSAENLFIVREGVLITPSTSSDILEGITRKSVIEIAKNENIEVVEREIDRTELYFADEVFLTGTGAKVSPVTEIDRRAINNGKVGSISQKIQDIYFKAVKGEISEYKSWLTAVY